MASDLERKARELLDTALRDLGLHEDAYHVGCGAELDQNDRAAINAIVAALRAAPPAKAVPEDVRRDAWRPVSEAPADTLCIVGWNDPDDGEARHDFDFLDEERWVGHDEQVEHAQMVAPPGSKLPPEEAPYQWFIEVPRFPVAKPQGEEVGRG